MELSILTDADIALILFCRGKMITFASEDMGKTLLRYTCPGGTKTKGPATLERVSPCETTA